jgi:hypothetical protein
MSRAIEPARDLTDNAGAGGPGALAASPGERDPSNLMQIILPQGSASEPLANDINRKESSDECQ